MVRTKGDLVSFSRSIKLGVLRLKLSHAMEEMAFDHQEAFKHRDGFVILENVAICLGATLRERHL
jgi:hypothetical protein